jgi:hypothetical protein
MFEIASTIAIRFLRGFTVRPDIGPAGVTLYAPAQTRHSIKLVRLSRSLPSIWPVTTAARLRVAHANLRQNVLGRTKACKRRLNQVDANEHCKKQPPVAYKVTERNAD